MVLDQADGLRRLLAGQSLRVIALLAPEAAAQSAGVAVNLAAALAYQGKRVVVVDESADAASPGTLADVVEGRLSLDVAARQAGDNVAVLAAGVVRGLHVQTIHDCLRDQADVVLIGAALGADGLSALAAQAHDMVIVMRAHAAAITPAYATIKRLHLVHALKQFRVLFEGVESSADARAIFQNLAGVASRYLGISLLPAGVVGADGEALARAQALGRSVVDAFPAARASAAFRRIAGEMLHWPWRPIAARPVPVGASAASASACASLARRELASATSGA
ncbi:MinD/ParA family ATP-binding protein [Chitinasiproducens palmae]